MATTCLGHQCIEGRYQAVVTNSVVKGKQGKGCPSDAEIVKAITDGWADDAHEEDHCDEKVCKCDMPAWTNKWQTLETGVVYSAAYVSIDCKADVTITYDWQYEERSAKCYRKAPTKGAGN